MYTWGTGLNGECIEKIGYNFNLPLKISNINNVSKAIAGDGYSLLLKNDGEVVYYGIMDYYNNINLHSKKSNSSNIKNKNIFLSKTKSLSKSRFSIYNSKISNKECTDLVISNYKNKDDLNINSTEDNSLFDIKPKKIVLNNISHYFIDVHVAYSFVVLRDNSNKLYVYNEDIKLHEIIIKDFIEKLIKNESTLKNKEKYTELNYNLSNISCFNNYSISNKNYKSNETLYSIKDIAISQNNIIINVIDFESNDNCLNKFRVKNNFFILLKYESHVLKEDFKITIPNKFTPYLLNPSTDIEGMHNTENKDINLFNNENNYKEIIFSYIYSNNRKDIDILDNKNINVCNNDKLNIQNEKYENINKELKDAKLYTNINTSKLTNNEKLIKHTLIEVVSPANKFELKHKLNDAINNNLLKREYNINIEKCEDDKINNNNNNNNNINNNQNVCKIYQLLNNEDKLLINLNTKFNIENNLKFNLESNDKKVNNINNICLSNNINTSSKNYVAAKEIKKFDYINNNIVKNNCIDLNLKDTNYTVNNLNDYEDKLLHTRIEGISYIPSKFDYEDEITNISFLFDKYEEISNNKQVASNKLFNHIIEENEKKNNTKKIENNFNNMNTKLNTNIKSNKYIVNKEAFSICNNIIKTISLTNNLNSKDNLCIDTICSIFINKKNDINNNLDLTSNKNNKNIKSIDDNLIIQTFSDNYYSCYNTKNIEVIQKNNNYLEAVNKKNCSSNNTENLNINSNINKEVNNYKNNNKCSTNLNTKINKIIKKIPNNKINTGKLSIKVKLNNKLKNMSKKIDVNTNIINTLENNKDCKNNIKDYNIVAKDQYINYKYINANTTKNMTKVKAINAFDMEEKVKISINNIKNLNHNIQKSQSKPKSNTSKSKIIIKNEGNKLISREEAIKKQFFKVKQINTKIKNNANKHLMFPEESSVRIIQKGKNK